MSETTRRTTPAWLLPVVVVLFLSAIAIVYVLTSGSRPSNEACGMAAPPADAKVNTTLDPGEYERKDPNDPVAVGSVDAPVTLVVFSDYQCKFCAKWNQKTLPKLMSHVDAGELRIEWRDANIFGEPSTLGARAVVAAGKQKKFLEFHDQLFANGSMPGADKLTDRGLFEIAQSIGLNIEQFKADYASKETRDEVMKNQELAQEMGVYSTPTFIMNGTPLIGAQSTQTFIDEFNKALEKKRK